MATARTQQGMMMGPMKGHLAPNSSPFKPTRNKLSSQYMIQDHMASHYNKLLTVRPAIDNKPPKSMMTSVKKRDQIKREVLAKQMKLSDFEREMKVTNSPARTPDPHLDGTYRSFSLKVPKNGYDEVRPQSSMSLYSYRSGTLSQRTSRPISATDHGSPRSDVLNKTYAGDYLERHEERFKNVNEPFTPRLKKRSGKSFLAQSKHYAPPLKLNKEVTRKTATGQTSKLSRSRSSLSEVSNKTLTKETEDRSWLEDKSELMERLTLDNSTEANRRVTSLKSTSTQQARPGSALGLFYGSPNLAKSYLESRSDAVTYETKSRIHAEDDEMKYLEFINKVTNDILTRGVYSDRVLTKLMERHLEENRGRLREDRMRHALIKLQQDLGISPSASSLYDSSTRAGSKTPPGSSRVSSRKSSFSTHVARKKSPRSAAARRRREDLAPGHTSGSETSNSEGRKSVRKGILKNPSDGRSSGSERDLRSNLSSGEDQSRISEHKNYDNTPKASSYDRETVIKTVFTTEQENASSHSIDSTTKLKQSGEHELPSSDEERDVKWKSSSAHDNRESLNQVDDYDDDF